MLKNERVMVVSVKIFVKKRNFRKNILDIVLFFHRFEVGFKI